MAANANPNQTSPKVKAGALMGLLVSLLGAVIAAIVTFGSGITADSLGGLGLGVWAVPVATLVTTGAQALAAWWKSDPLRQNYLTQQAAVEADFQEKAAARFTGNQG